MPANSIPLAGYNTIGVIDGNPIIITEWEVSPEVEDMDGSATETGGFHVPFAGMMKAEITLTGWFDGANNPYSSFGLIPGTFVGVEIFLDDSETVGWEFDSAMVKSAPNKGSIKEKVMFTCHLIGSGEFIYPTGNVA